MLQWMGGSRKKVASSRKSTQNRQKQYFEQRKRLQQARELENCDDTQNKRSCYYREPRSLDVLSILNSATAPQVSDNSKLSAAQASSPYSKSSAEVLLNNRSDTQTNTKPSKLATQIHMSLDHQKAPDSRYEHDRRKKLESSCGYASTKTDKEQSGRKEFHEISVLDLLGEDGPRETLNARSIPEPHVALSVEGLGKLGFGTPAQSPKLRSRGPPLPPKPSRLIRTAKSFEPSSYDLGVKFDMMHDIRVEDGGHEPIRNSRDTFQNDFFSSKNTMDGFWCTSPDAYSNKVEIADDAEESFDAYTECQKKQPNSEYGILEDSLVGDEYDAPWKNKTLNPEDFSTFNYRSNGFNELLSPQSRPFTYRPSFEEENIPNISASPPYFKQFAPDPEYSPRNCDQRRKSNVHTMFSSPDWASLVEDDPEDSTSFLSEELCLSAAGRKARNYDLRNSVNLKERKIRHQELHKKRSNGGHHFKQFSAGGMLDENLDDMYQEENLFGSWNHEGKVNNWSAPEGNFSKNVFEFGENLEPECVSLPQELYNSARVASAPNTCPRTDSGNRSSRSKLMSEDEIFKLFEGPSLEAVHRESKSKISINHEFPNKFVRKSKTSRKLFDSDTELQKPGSFSFETEDNFPYFSSTGVRQGDFLFPDLSKQKTASKDSENNKHEETTEMVQQNYSSEVNAVSSKQSNTDVLEDNKNCSGDTEVVEQSQEQSDCSKTVILSDDEAAEMPRENAEAPSQLERKLSQFSSSSPVLSQVRSKGSVKERSKSKSNGGASYPLMLESYVLQLLCVQKVVKLGACL